MYERERERERERGREGGREREREGRGERTKGNKASGNSPKSTQCNTKLAGEREGEMGRETGEGRTGERCEGVAVSVISNLSPVSTLKTRSALTPTPVPPSFTES